MLLCLVSKPSVAHTGHRMPFVAQRTRRLFLFGQASQVDALLTPRLASSRLNPNQVRQCAAPTETTKRPAWGENVRYLGTCGELGSTTYIAGYTWANVFLAWGPVFITLRERRFHIQSHIVDPCAEPGGRTTYSQGTHTPVAARIAPVDPAPRPHDAAPNKVRRLDYSLLHAGRAVLKCWSEP